MILNPGAANEQFAHANFARANFARANFARANFARANFARAQLTLHKDNVPVFEEIVAGRIDVMVTDGIEHKELCPTAVPTPFTRLAKACRMPKHPEPLAAVDAWLAGETSTGAWQRTLDAARREP